jgi:hypothetical protein
MLQAKLLEHNVRFGDPECQGLMARLDTDLVDALVKVGLMKRILRRLAMQQLPFMVDVLCMLCLHYKACDGVEGVKGAMEGVIPLGRGHKAGCSRST